MNAGGYLNDRLGVFRHRFRFSFSLFRFIVFFGLSDVFSSFFVSFDDLRRSFRFSFRLPPYSSVSFRLPFTVQFTVYCLSFCLAYNIKLCDIWF